MTPTEAAGEISSILSFFPQDRFKFFGPTSSLQSVTHSPQDSNNDCDQFLSGGTGHSFLPLLASLLVLGGSRAKLLNSIICSCDPTWCTPHPLGRKHGKVSASQGRQAGDAEAEHLCRNLGIKIFLFPLLNADVINSNS